MRTVSGDWKWHECHVFWIYTFVVQPRVRALSVYVAISGQRYDVLT